MAADAVLVGARGVSAGSSVSTTAGSVSAGDTIIVVTSFDSTRTISSIPLSGSGADTLTLLGSVITGTGKLAVYLKQNATGGASVSVTANFSGTAAPVIHMLKATGVAAASLDASSTVQNATDTTTPWTITSNAFAQANNIVIACIEQNTGTASGAYASSNFTVVSSEPDLNTYWTSAVGKLYVTSTSAVTPSWTHTNSTNAAAGQIVFALKEAGASAPTLSAATPSGTIGTPNSATLGCTTDQTSGTLYGVVDVAANITGVSAAQVKAGQNNAGAAPVASGNSTVSTTGPSVSVTGLAANTLYSYALVQNNGSDSNVITGTFTTALVSNPQARVYGPKGFINTLLTM